MIVNILLLIAGFVLLIKGADFFVESSSKLAKKLGVSEFIIGLTLVAIGTSIPEISSSIFAAIQNESGLITGNVIGSNIANIGLVLGISTALVAVKVKKLMIRRDGFIMLFATIAFFLLALNGSISLGEGIFFLLLYIGYVSFLISTRDDERTYNFEDFVDYFMKFKYLLTIKDVAVKNVFTKKEPKSIKDKKEYTAFKEGLVKDFLVIILSLIAIVYGAKLLVEQAIFFANILNIATNVIGLTLVAFGTSLPELGVILRAAKKGYGDMVIGNVIGSNITNILVVIGIASIITPIKITFSTLAFTIPTMILFSVLLLFAMITKRKILRIEGLILFLLYILFILATFFFF